MDLSCILKRPQLTIDKHVKSEEIISQHLLKLD